MIRHYANLCHTQEFFSLACPSIVRLALRWLPSFFAMLFSFSDDCHRHDIIYHYFRCHTPLQEGHHYRRSPPLLINIVAFFIVLYDIY